MGSLDDVDFASIDQNKAEKLAQLLNFNPRADAPIQKRSMMEKEEVRHPDKSPGPMPYSHGIAIGDWLYVSGQGPINMKTGAIVKGSIEDQTRVTLENIGAILKAGGCTFDDIVKCTCYLQDIAEFEVFNDVYASFFPGVRPARTTIQSVLLGGIRVEIDAVAFKTSRHSFL